MNYNVVVCHQEISRCYTTVAVEAASQDEAKEKVSAWMEKADEETQEMLADGGGDTSEATIEVIECVEGDSNEADFILEDEPATAEAVS